MAEPRIFDLGLGYRLFVPLKKQLYYLFVLQNIASQKSPYEERSSPSVISGIFPLEISSSADHLPILGKINVILNCSNRTAYSGSQGVVNNSFNIGADILVDMFNLRRNNFREITLGIVFA